MTPSLLLGGRTRLFFEFLLESSYSSGARITIITLSKEDAVNISNDVGNAGITSQWLTSDCTEAERRERMKDWPKGVIKSLASTFNCGTDSPFVSGVEHAGLPRGVAAALQAAGRVRPKENAYFCPEELVSTLMDMSIRVGRS